MAVSQSDYLELFPDRIIRTHTDSVGQITCLLWLMIYTWYNLPESLWKKAILEELETESVPKNCYGPLIRCFIWWIRKKATFGVNLTAWEKLNLIICPKTRPFETYLMPNYSSSIHKGTLGLEWNLFIPDNMWKNERGTLWWNKKDQESHSRLSPI